MGLLEDLLALINGTIDGITSFFTTARNFLLNIELGIYSLTFIILFIVFISIVISLISSPIWINKLIADNSDVFKKIKSLISKIIGK